jgi:hypothetical protein
MICIETETTKMTIDSKSGFSNQRIFTAEEIHRHKTTPVFKVVDTIGLVDEAIEALNAARVVTATKVFSSLDKIHYEDDAEYHQGLVRNRVRVAIASQVADAVNISETEHEPPFDTWSSSTDTHITGRLVVMPESVLIDVLRILNDIINR